MLNAFLAILANRTGMKRRALRRLAARVDAHALWDDLGNVVDKLEDGYYDEARPMQPRNEQTPVAPSERYFDHVFMMYIAKGLALPEQVQTYADRRIKARDAVLARGVFVKLSSAVRSTRRLIHVELARMAEYYDDPMSQALGVEPPPYPLAPVASRLRDEMRKLDVTPSEVIEALDGYTEIMCSHTSYGQAPPTHYEASFLCEVFNIHR